MKQVSQSVYRPQGHTVLLQLPAVSIWNRKLSKFWLYRKDYQLFFPFSVRCTLQCKATSGAPESVYLHCKCYDMQNYLWSRSKILLLVAPPIPIHAHVFLIPFCCCFVLNISFSSKYEKKCTKIGS